MADAKKTDAKTAQKKLNLAMRDIIGEAYAFVRGREFTKQMANVTYEQLIDEAIDHIEGTPGKVPLRPTLLDRISKIKTKIEGAVNTVKSKSINYWALDNQDSNVNTDEKDSTKTTA